uniref:Uncharacterized protein n=1 Tax=Anguilla anguilla TaxID=7936 RepID=A0A0E9S0G9_ANGAN
MDKTAHELCTLKTICGFPLSFQRQGTTPD